MIEGGAGVPPPRASLFTWSFKLILAISFLAFGMESIIRVLVPLIVLERGGDAVMVGVVATAYALPSLLFRPLVGKLVDSWHHGLLLRSGMLVAALAPTFLLLPGILTMVIVRFVCGIGWGFFSVSNHSLVAKLAPVHRRAEASGLFMTTPAISQLILPGLGVAIYTAGRETPAILLAVALGVGAFAITTRIEVPPTPPRAAVAEGAGRTSLIERFVEPSALAGTAMLVTSFSAWSVFTIFPSVYVQHVGSPVEVLVVYFPIFGLAQAISQPFFGRFADQLGRIRSITLGAAIAIVGLLIPIIPADGVPPMVTFSIGAFIYALSQSLVSPTISALVMERAPRHRLGSAMATYSIGYQFSTGAGSIIWGAVITSFGFSWVFVVGIGFQLLTMVLCRLLLGSTRPARPRI